LSITGSLYRKWRTGCRSGDRKAGRDEEEHCGKHKAMDLHNF
jgi:hypothetical protein